MKILMVCGLYPPEKCGIGDYIFQIVNELKKKQGIEIIILSNINWKIGNLLSIIKKIKSSEPDIIHIQYPSVGYGNSFVPHFISFLFKKTIVTIHEVSDVKKLRQYSLFFFSLRSLLIFTNKFELRNFKKLFPWYHKKELIIPIGSNINFQYIPKLEYIEKDFIEIIYFGYIRPKKGIEQVIELASLLKNNIKYKIIIMGNLLPMQEDYYQILKQKINSSNIEWRLNLSEKEVFNNLRNATYVYLPFPDGLSERRGSFLASLCSGTPIFTQKGNQSTEDMLALVNIVNKPIDFASILQSENPNKYYIRQKKMDVAKYLIAHSWQNIADIHYDLYKNFIS